MNQADQASNQYGFYAVPKALEPKKKYRQTFQEESKYSDQQVEEQNQFQALDKQPENEKQLERDFYVDEAPYPQFKPKQRGLDYGVQIQRHQLFDFDMQVQPLIEILVGRSVVSAINQLQQQKQSTQRQKNLDTYQKKRNAQLMQTQRLQTKHNRKQDEVKRRILQKQTYTKNRKIATQKLIARKNAKHGLLNLKNQLLGQLEEQGFLRQSTYLSLRVQYQSWLYDQIKSIVNQHKKIQETAESIIKQKQKQVKNQHQQHINKQNKRRKDILDERQRVRKQNQQRKLKKRIRKQRLGLNAQRSIRNNQAAQLVNKYEPVEKLLKAESISNGLTRKKNAPQTVHIAGGLLNYVVALINSQGNHSAQQIENILQKLLSQLSTKLQVEVSAAHMAKIEQARANMEANPIQFMTHKDIFIKELIEKISLELSVLEATGVSIKSQVHSSILNALLNIYLNCLPAPKMDGQQVVAAYQATQKDKKRQELKNKVEFVPVQSSSLSNLKSAENAVRVRFEKIRPQSQSNKAQQIDAQQGQQKPVDLDQWIDIYDGQGWQRQKKQQLKQAPRQNQHASTYVLTGFDNCFVMDERNLFYLQAELQKLLGIHGGQQMTKYRDRLQHILSSKDKIPIYDIELKWQ